MKPQLAQAIDPVFLRVLGLLERIEGNNAVVAAEEKRVLEALFREAESELQAESREWAKAWESAKYPLVSWIDEMLVAAHIWPGREDWAKKVLEETICKSRNCYDQFYVKAKQALGQGDVDSVELFYICVLLGFRGIYRDSRSEQAKIDTLGLSTDLPEWVARFAGVVERIQEETALPISRDGRQEPLQTATPLWRRSQIVWPWMLSVIFAGANFLYFYWR